ncbi:sialin [Tetranychus urticae]|uniref:Major facilitator superfamily (MFS) profile domain-containing protein n=1 Tax=Tetranychus urticae TaxID=32264 RepID=T1KA43_TETUR|nr:sialin [Tetranychus urticae]
MYLRYIILATATLANCLEYALRDNMSIAIVAMVNNNLTSKAVVKPDELNNKFDWSPTTQGLILGAFYYGYIIAHMIGGQFCAWLGPRFLVSLSIFFSSLFTLLIPSAAYHSPTTVAVARSLLGVVQGFLTPSLYALFSQWIPKRERSFALAMLVVGGNCGSLFTMLISGYLAESSFAGGWPSVFYVLGSAGLVVLLIWIYVVRNDPDSHPTISESERKLITESLAEENKNVNLVNGNHKIPWTAILLSPAVWAVGIAKFAGKWGYITWETELPTYLAQALGLNLKQNSAINALRYMSMSISLLVTGFISDAIERRNLISRTTSRKIFEAIALIGPAVMTSIIPFITNNTAGIITALVVSMTLWGFCAGGDNPMVVDISPINSGAIYGFTAGLSSFPGPLAPYFVGYVLELGGGNPEVWNYVFWSCSLFYIIGAIFFTIFGTSKEQDFENFNMPTIFGGKPEGKVINVDCEKSKQSGDEKIRI